MEGVAVDFGCWLVGRGFTTVGPRVGCFGSAVYMGVWVVCGSHKRVGFWGLSVTVVVGVLAENGFSWVAISEFVGCLW